MIRPDPPMRVELDPPVAAGERGRAARSVERATHARRGAVLVEFALIAFAFYLLLAGTVEIGRMILSSQLLNNAARVGARELSVIPLPATMTFDQAINAPIDITQVASDPMLRAAQDVRNTIYDKGLLVLDVTNLTANQIQAEIDSWPVVNRMLSSLMIRERVTIGSGTQELLRYPGALIANPNQGSPYFEASPYYVMIPHVVSRNAQGHEVIEWLPVVEEVRPSSTASDAPFSIASTGPAGMRGVVALRIHYPYQASMASGYLETAPGSPLQNTPIEADDNAVSAAGFTPVPHTSDLPSQSGSYGLGKLYVLGKDVRPYRRLISAQSIFRRERLGR